MCSPRHSILLFLILHNRAILVWNFISNELYHKFNFPSLLNNKGKLFHAAWDPLDYMWARLTSSKTLDLHHHYLLIMKAHGCTWIRWFLNWYYELWVHAIFSYGTWCSAEMLVNLGIPWVILGHSERRLLLGESNEVNSFTVILEFCHLL